ncbi:hypothetical protein RIF29_26569 [Crotalaria pallida]|uniref:Uncharacterized protein n=1 Tax=Crotalaria pallida TaxID=3830 RepID=A0AAN9I1S3_CROPI
MRPNRCSGTAVIAIVCLSPSCLGPLSIPTGSRCHRPKSLAMVEARVFHLDLASAMVVCVRLLVYVSGDEAEDFHNSKKIRGEHPSVSSQSLGVVSEVAGSSSKLVSGLDDNSPPCIVKVRISRLTVDENSQDKSFLSKDTDIIEGDGKKLSKLGKCRSRLSKTDSALDCGADVDGDHVHGPPSTREEKGLVHVARKMPKNAHAHFILGLMYQRLSQPQKVML